MRSIKVNDNEYRLEYTFEAAEHKELVQKMFDMSSGAYIAKRTGGHITEQEAASAVISGVSEMISDIPYVCRIAFYAGMLENNPVSEDEAKAIMKQYMKDRKIGYRELFEEIKRDMEDDGFFDLSGLTEALKQMGTEMQKSTGVKPRTVTRKKTAQTSTK